MGAAGIEWCWGQRAEVFGVKLWDGYEQRVYGLRVGRRLLGVVLSRRTEVA